MGKEITIGKQNKRSFYVDVKAGDEEFGGKRIYFTVNDFSNNLTTEKMEKLFIESLTKEKPQEIPVVALNNTVKRKRKIRRKKWNRKEDNILAEFRNSGKTSRQISNKIFKETGRKRTPGAVLARCYVKEL